MRVIAFTLVTCMPVCGVFADIGISEHRLFMTPEQRALLDRTKNELAAVPPGAVSAAQDPAVEGYATNGVPHLSSVAEELAVIKAEITYNGVVVRPTTPPNLAAIVWLDKKMQAPADWNSLHQGKQSIKLEKYQQALLISPGQTFVVSVGNKF